jgi:hypothetical protein
MSEGFAGWAKAHRAVTTFKSTDEKVGTLRFAHLQILGNN